jgi:hypothetical protein
VGAGVSATARLAVAAPPARGSIPIEAFGELVAISRMGGQGRVHRPAQVPSELGPGPVVIKLYRHLPPEGAARALSQMVSWSRLLDIAEAARLHRVAAWPLALVTAGTTPVGIAMADVSARFTVPFLMPSGRREQVLLALEHLLGPDAFLQQRGLGVRLDTTVRTAVADRVSEALGYLHRHAIVVSDLAPSNLLIAFTAEGPEVCFIDCDSMVFRGRQALTSVETGDWNIPGEFAEPPSTRAADAYKLGLVVLRLFARSHDARGLGPHLRFVPIELRDLLYRALDRDAANRPPAGEWQRALRELLARGGLNERYPGPVVRRLPLAAAAPARHRVRRAAGTLAASPARARAAPARVQAAPAANPAPRSAPSSGGDWLWLRRGVVALWMLTGTVVLFLVLSRLFASALPSPPAGSTGGGVPGSFGAQNAYPYYYGGPGGGVAAGTVAGGDVPGGGVPRGGQAPGLGLTQGR